MLPFLKKHDESTPISQEVDVSMGFDILDAIAEDMIVAVHTKDKGLLKSALEAFKEELQSQDEIQDIGI